MNISSHLSSYAELKAAVIKLWSQQGQVLCAVCERPCLRPPELHHLTTGGMGRDKHKGESIENTAPVHSPVEAQCHRVVETQEWTQRVLSRIQRRLHEQRKRHGDEPA
jgi:hypothetical protein